MLFYNIVVSTPNINLFADYEEYLKNQIISGGYDINASDNFDKISYKFFNIQRREIHSHPRTVYESNVFSCPTEHLTGYQELKRKVETGENINPHQSKSLLNTDFEDALINDWGIHHFHLGTNLDGSGFTNRTGPLLFALVKQDAFFSINIFPHGAWTEQNLIKILHENWPNEISQFQLKGIIGLSHKPTNEDIKKLRAAGIQTMIEISPGIVYGPVGGGYSTAGTSIQATMRSDYYRRLVRNIEEHVKNNIEIYISKITELGFTSSNSVDFKLIINDVGFHVLETNSGVCFLVHPHNHC